MSDQVQQIDVGTAGVYAEDARLEQEKNAAIEKLLADAKDLKEKYQQVVNRNANPNPILIAALVLLVLVLVFWLYLVLLKPRLTGTWMDTDDNEWNLTHCIYTGKVKVDILDKTKKPVMNGFGEVSDNVFTFGATIGLWNYGDVILFVGKQGGGLERVVNK